MYSNRVDKKLTNKLRKFYNEECYSGASSFLFNKSHDMMEKFLPEKKIKHILEIGAGIHPHHKYIKHSYERYYCLENSKFAIKFLNKKYPKIKTLYSDNGLIPSKKKFDRIILSHSLEHIYKPEKLLNDMYKSLNKDGVISVAIPIDPGILYGLLRYVKKKFFSQYKISEKEYDYINAIEHINSYDNNKAIIKYLFKNYKQYYYPFNFLPSNLNIFSFFQIYK